MVYSPLFRDFRAWKRYRGGWAEDLWVFDLASHAATNITNNPWTDRDPMWIGDRIFFDSDRSGTLNLYSVKPDGTDLAQLTRDSLWDVRWPSADEAGRIVYELDGELHVFDTRTSADRKLAITVPDDQLAARPTHRSVAKYIEDYALSPDGQRVVFVARGDVFTVPAEHGPTRNLTASSNAHDKGARWSPDGRKIAFISDMSGEEELYLIDQDGSGKPERLTTNGDMMRYPPEWSPDGKRLAFADKAGRLWVLTLADRKLTQVAHDSGGRVRDQAWSPDGRWLAFSLSHATGYRSLFIWGVGDPAPHQVTDALTNSFEPVFDPEGNYLYFLSDHEYAPQVSSREWDYATDRMTGIYALTLRKDVPPPFPPRSDEVRIDSTRANGGRPKEKAGADSSGKAGPGPVVIDFDGLAERVAPVPVPADDYGGLVAVQGNLLYARGTPFVYGREPDRQPALMIFNLKDRKASTLAEDIRGFTVSADGKKVLVRQGPGFNLYDATPKGADSKKPVSTDGLQADIVPQQEWAEIFEE
ncbi:MAG TPA: hypothetical protein VNH46_05325, partial [Gemmatimonadales bacterium]|nr:hypothetical protein [Gemmatimonadales bacterium]